MESDFRAHDFPADDRWSDDLPDVGGADDLPPPEDRGPEPLPPRPPGPGGGRPADPEPVTGPWFALSMAVFVAWAALTLGVMSLDRSAGEVGAWIAISAFIAMYWGFLVVGARWFGDWRRA